MHPTVRNVVLGLVGQSGGAFPMPILRAGKARVLSGAGDMQLGFIGDSKTLGRGSNGADYTNCKANSVPRQVAALLSAAGLPAAETSVLGTGRAGKANFLSADTRVASLAAAWTEFGSDSIAGFMFINSSDTSSFSFTTPNPIDGISVFDSTQTGYAEWTVNVDGGSALATVAAQSARARKTPVTCARGTHTVNIQRTGVGSNLIAIGVDTSDSQTRRVRVHNLGSSGSQASYWNTAANNWSPLNMIPILGCDAWVINLPTNDWINAIADATTMASLLGLIAGCKAAGGDVIMIAPSFSNPAVTAQAVQDATLAVVRNVASQTRINLIDESKIIGPFVAANLAGLYFDDTHESGAGYALEAAAIASFLLAA